MSARRYVTTYEDVRCYGGPEEGGWYYTVTEYVGHMYRKSNREAKAQFHLLQDELEEGQFLRIETARTLGSEDTTNDPRPHYE